MIVIREEILKVEDDEARSLDAHPGFIPNDDRLQLVASNGEGSERVIETRRKESVSALRLNRQPSGNLDVRLSAELPDPSCAIPEGGDDLTLEGIPGVARPLPANGLFFIRLRDREILHPRHYFVPTQARCRHVIPDRLFPESKEIHFTRYASFRAEIGDEHPPQGETINLGSFRGPAFFFALTPAIPEAYPMIRYRRNSRNPLTRSSPLSEGSRNPSPIAYFAILSDSA